MSLFQLQVAGLKRCMFVSSKDNYAFQRRYQVVKFEAETNNGGM